MPSATNGTRTVKSASPDLGSLTGAPSEALKQVLVLLEKKVRNMEKKKSKLDDYQARNLKGERLNQDQLEALSKYQEIIHNLEFARELHKSFLALGQEIQKSVKKAARREQLQREEVEQKRLKRVLELQFLLDRLGDESVRQELLQGAGGPSLLTESELTSLDEFYKLVGPERDQNIRLTDQYQEASQHLWELLEGKDKPVAGTTYKALNETLERVLQSGYFDRMQCHQNGVCTEEEEEEEEQTAFVNRQFVLESTYSTGDKEQREEWSAEIEVNSRWFRISWHRCRDHTTSCRCFFFFFLYFVFLYYLANLCMHAKCSFCFQDSMLDFDGQSLDPAIVSAQPMKPVPSMEMPPMVCPPGMFTFPPHGHSVSFMETFSTPPPIYQSSHAADPQPQTDSIDPIQASMPLTEQPPPSTVLPPASQTQVIQPGSKPLHSSGINVNAAPFQSMQTVFNLNAPVPPANDTDSMKQASQYQNSYSQGFNSQTQHPVEQADMPPEQLQSVGAFHSQDQSLPNSTGPQPMSQQSGGQGNGFSRQAQSFYNSRGISRGGPRNSRGMINGYRGPSNGFRGGYDGYRPHFSNSANSGYGQTQFSAPRDYSNSGYQRDGYQQNYKRGAGQGPRGVSRGSAPAMRS
uniref:Caprin-1-like n=1 Tax=Cyprinus carpio TaxID=7962 RepID=A0A8C1N9S8_CYPCA